MAGGREISGGTKSRRDPRDLAGIRTYPLATAGAQNGRSSSSASSASGKSSNDSLPLGAAAAAPAATLLGAEYEDSDPSDRPESMISSRAVVPGVALSVLPRPVFDAALDAHLVSLLAVLLGAVAEGRALVVPQHHTV